MPRVQAGVLAAAPGEVPVNSQHRPSDMQVKSFQKVPASSSPSRPLPLQQSLPSTPGKDELSE